MDAMLDGDGRTPPLSRIIARLHGLRLKDLRVLWQQEIGSDAPPVRSPNFIRRLLAWKLQENIHGGLDPQTRKRLRALGDAYAKNPNFSPSPNLNLKPGTVLGRLWKGVRHDVAVTRAGFLYDGETFASLSKVARHITGTRWNGPRFFGLRPSPKEPARHRHSAAHRAGTGHADQAPRLVETRHLEGEALCSLQVILAPRNGRHL